MKVYKYKKGLFGTKLKGYQNQNPNFNVETSKTGITVSKKSGEVVFSLNNNKNIKVYIHNSNKHFVVESFDKKEKVSSFLIFEDDKLIKKATVNGAVEQVIIGAEDVYFKQFVNYSGNRFYYQIVKDGDLKVTPNYQVINHEVDNGKDKFYCENYKELSKDEFLEEDDVEYENNIEDIAIYLSDGRLYDQRTFEEPKYEPLIADKDKSYIATMLSGVAIMPINPIAGSTIMAIANIKKSRENSQEENSQEENQPGMD